VVSRASTCQCHLLHLVRARVHVRVACVSYRYHGWDCQIISELVRAMIITAEIVRDHVTPTLVRATLVRSTIAKLELSETISECTFIAGIIKDYVRATLVRATLIRSGLPDYIRDALTPVEW